MSPNKRILQFLLPKRLIVDEKGMTVIELLTALVLLTMVSMLLSSFLFMGISMYKRVNAVSQIRNQGDALMGQIISELKDAVYVSNGTPAEKDLANAITFVKRDLEPTKYINGYTMAIEVNKDHRFGIAVRDSADNLLKRFDLSSPYTLRTRSESDQALSSIRVSGNLIEIHLVYEKAMVNQTNAALMENPSYEMDTQIPLFRSE